MVNAAQQPAAPVTYPEYSLGWIAAQLNLELDEARSLVKGSHKDLALNAPPETMIPKAKADRLLATKSERDSVLRLNAAPSPQSQTEAAPPATEDGTQEKGGAIATERRRLNIEEVKGIAATTGVAQKLVKQLDETCFNREQELYALRGFQREQRLIEADATGRLIARLQHSDNLNDELDALEIELAENTSRASDLSSRVFGVNLQQVIDSQAETEEERIEAREAMKGNFEVFKAQETARLEAEARGEEYQAPEGERLGEDELIDPWLMTQHGLSGLGVKRTSRLKRVSTASKRTN